jgi:hypothetical protein
VKPEATGRALLCALASGLLGACTLGSIVPAANLGGSPKRSLSVVASQLVFDLRNRPPGAVGPIARSVGLLNGLGVLLIPVGGILVVCS